MSKKEKTDIAIGIIVVLIALAFILFYTFKGDTSFLVKDTIEQSDLTEIEIDDKIYEKVEEELIIEKENNAVIVAENQKIDSSRIQTIDSIEVKVDEVKSDLNNVKEVIPSQKNFDFSDETENNGDEIINEESQIKEQVKPVTPIEKEVQEKVRTPSSSDDCIIVIGSFAENKNSRKLKENLVSDGYRIFETPFRGLNRIGIYTSCNQSNLQSELRKVRSKYASDAVIFKNK
jgi:hypothetical protein